MQETRILRPIHRLGFILFMELAIIAVAVAQGAVLGELSAEAKLRWGFGLHNSFQGLHAFKDKFHPQWSPPVPGLSWASQPASRWHRHDPRQLGG